MKPTQSQVLITNILAVFLIAQSSQQTFNAELMRPDPGLTQDFAQVAKSGLYKPLATSLTATLAVGADGNQIEVSPTEVSASLDNDCGKSFKIVSEKITGVDLNSPPLLTSSPPNSPPALKPEDLVPPQGVGQGFSGGAQNNPASAALPTSSVRSLASSARIAAFGSSNERAVDIIDATLDRKRAIDSSARNDTQTLVENVSQLPLSQLGGALAKAKDRLGVSAMALFQAKAGLDEGEAKRFGNTFLSAQDKADAALELIGQAQFREQVASQSPFKSLLMGDPSQGSELKKAFAELFTGLRDTLSPTSQDALTDRLVLYHMIPEKNLLGLRDQLGLLEGVELTLANGQKQSVDLLHNGYLLKGKSGVSCSTLASAVLGPHVRQGGLTTIDFRAIWELQQTGVFPKEPKYSKDREALIRKIAPSFSAHNLYAGDRPRPGDFLVYSVPWKAIGHVFIVRNYNPQAMKAQVLEAAQSAGGIRDRDFSLTLYPGDAPKRHIRPGLMVLRLQQDDKAACKTDREVASR